MSDHEVALAEQVRSLIDVSMAHSDRSVFGRSKLGVSDIGHCREYARRLIVGDERDEVQQSYLAAFVGTAVGAAIEQEWVKTHPDYRRQMEVVVTLTVSEFLLKIPGHPDLVGPDEVIDFKTVNGLGVVRTKGATLQQKFQTSLYAKALIETGELPPDPWLSLVYLDRSGSERDPVVVSWKYDEGVVREAEEWLGDVIYAVVNNETASRDMPREWCFACCDFAPSCRGLDTDVEGLITDPLLLDAIDVYLAANVRKSVADKDVKSALSVLKDVTGSTGTHTIRWVDVPGGHIEFNRQGYRRPSISPVPPPKRRKTND